MTGSIKKLHILITGATSGIGNQLAKDYLLEGHHVYAVGRDDSALAELKALGAETVDLDLMEREKVIEGFEKIAEVDLAICGAGMCEYLD
ncbi:SDR family NAD(P)-dependent oxidoreductase, partial [Psychrobacter aquimaris]|uniref:SDR family NAD(P)-dependent oxidoreductase n=1 Tax=Psychrobacter aquimaris TaxID=292733 RepID=UPI003FCF7E95